MRPFKVGKKSVTQDFNTYYYSNPIIDYKKGVKVRAIAKKKGINDLLINKCLTFEEAKQYLVLTEQSAKQLANNSTQFTYVSESFDYSPIIGKTSYLYRTGVESTPFEIFKMLGEGASNKENHYRFKNKVLKTSKYKVDDIPQIGWDFPVELLFPMVEGPAIKPFTFDWGNNYHLIPYKREDTSKPIALDELTKENPEVAVYFCNHRFLLDQQSDKSKTMHQGDEFYALSKIGPYTFAPYIVAARDNSNFCSSVINPVLTPWGEVKQAICVKHTIIISQDVDGNFISEEESHYINAILNSSIVHSYIHSTFKTNGFSLKKSNLCIPKFDISNRLHNRLVILSKYASLKKNEKKRERVAELASKLYVMACQEYKNAHTAQIFELPEIESIDMAAEPFECYNWNRLDQDIIDLFGGDKTILVGCFKDKKHLAWIKENCIYNIRLGNRTGSIDEDKECINNASILVLYSTRKKSEVSVFRITSHCVMTETEMKAKGYPNKKVGKRYMTFNIEEEPSMVELIKNHNLVGKLIESYPEHVSGAPVFLEP